MPTCCRLLPELRPLEMASTAWAVTAFTYLPHLVLSLPSAVYIAHGKCLLSVAAAAAAAAAEPSFSWTRPRGADHAHHACFAGAVAMPTISATAIATCHSLLSYPQLPPAIAICNNRARKLLQQRKLAAGTSKFTSVLTSMPPA